MVTRKRRRTKRSIFIQITMVMIRNTILSLSKDWAQSMIRDTKTLSIKKVDLTQHLVHTKILTILIIPRVNITTTKNLEAKGTPTISIRNLPLSHHIKTTINDNRNDTQRARIALSKTPWNHSKNRDSTPIPTLLNLNLLLQLLLFPALNLMPISLNFKPLRNSHRSSNLNQLPYFLRNTKPLQ